MEVRLEVISWQAIIETPIMVRTMANGGKKRPTVMISSTLRDLPDHRQQAMAACLGRGMFPKMMEHLPASDADTIHDSLELVNDADIYVGVFGFRYGYVPSGHDISITEMEYNRAVSRNIPCLIFLMHQDHVVRPADVETGVGAEKLEKFKHKLQKHRVVRFFRSAEDLRAGVIDSLFPYSNTGYLHQATNEFEQGLASSGKTTLPTSEQFNSTLLSRMEKTKAINRRQFSLGQDRKNRLSNMVLAQVEARFGALDLKGFTCELATFETEVQTITTLCLFDYISSSFPSFERVGHSFSFGSKGKRFILEIGPRVGSPILEVLLFKEDQKPPTYPDVEISLPGWGFYTNIHLSLPLDLQPHTSAISELLRVVYLVAYRWLGDTLLSRLGALETQASVSLYSSLRTALLIAQNEDLADFIRFGAVVNDGLFYLVDRRTCSSLITAINGRKFWSNSSPALSILNLLGFPLEYGKSFSRHAVVEQKPLDFTLPEATYITDNPEYLRAEREMVSGNKITVFPVSTKATVTLFANFPTSKKREIIPVLEANKDELSKIYERHLDDITKSIDALKSWFNTVDWASAADVVSGLVGGVLKAATGTPLQFARKYDSLGRPGPHDPNS